MADAVSEPVSAADQPALSRHRPLRVVAAVGIAIALVILAVGATARFAPDLFMEAPAGDRAKHGHGYVRG